MEKEVRYMIIVYESKTGFTKKYAQMLADRTKFRCLNVKEILKSNSDEDVIFLGWLKAGEIQGLSKLRKRNIRIKAVCVTGLARIAEPSPEAVIERNNIKNIPFFYLRGGCLPVNELKGIDKIMMKMFVKMLKSRKNKDEELIESINHIENGYDGVEEKNLEPVLKWLEDKA